MKTFIKLINFVKDSKKISNILLPCVEFTKGDKLFSYKYGDVFMYEDELICVYTEAEKHCLKEFYFVQVKSLGKKNEDIKYASLISLNKRDLIFIGNYFEKPDYLMAYIDKSFGYSSLLEYLYMNYQKEIQFAQFQLENEPSFQHINDLMLNYSININQEKDDYGFSFNNIVINLNEEIVVYFNAPFFQNDILKIELPFESIGIISESHFILPVMKDGEPYIHELVDNKLKFYTMKNWMQQRFENSYRKIQILYKKNDCLDYIYYLSSINQ